ncbi:MAG: response regulator [Tepidisphaeraceae bacterium]|jgi:signal transduction histidine kinase/DNA-binding response OmpR family regulator
MSESSVNILVVDDRSDKLLAMEAVLEDLRQNVICAYSGRDALREVLKREFAVILLDVNMPGMDGFETASMIRQRRESADTPIIFLTAMGDDMHVARSYSLGAVDYILTPVVPQILRSKVAVFVDLFRKTQQVRLQAERLRQRAAQLHQLSTASIAINSAPSVEEVVRIAAQTIRQIIDAHQAVAIHTSPRYASQAIQFADYSPRFASWRGKPPLMRDPAVLAIVGAAGKPVRMIHSELETQVPHNGTPHDAPPLHGLLATPLLARDGRRLGAILLSDKVGGEFTDDDQALLTQLAQMASVAIENRIFAAEREDNRLKEEFLSTLSHELRTPLNAMSGWIQLLRREPVNGEIGHGLEIIERNVQTQTRLIEDLLDVSRISNGKLRINSRPVLLRGILNSAIDSLRPVMAERKINLVCDLEEIDPTVIGDADRLQQVFSNLLNNAIKFTPAGGTITVRLRRTPTALTVTVHDTGQGMDRDFLPHIFERFRQADSSITRGHGGLGIGLTIVRHLVELHGGLVVAESPGKGHGSTFTVKLPEAPPQQRPVEAVPELPADLPSLRGLSVLVVDDRPDGREIVSEILRRQHAAVTVADSAPKALESLAASRPHLVVTDLGMPEQDGYALLRELRDLPSDQGGKLPVIALTAYASAEDRHRVLEAGFQAHLAKPVDPHELVHAVYTFASRPELAPVQ